MSQLLFSEGTTRHIIIDVEHREIFTLQGGTAAFADLLIAKAHTNCTTDKIFCLHHITGTAFITQLKLYVYIVRDTETVKKIIVLYCLSGHILFY